MKISSEALGRMIRRAPPAGPARRKISRCFPGPNGVEAGANAVPPGRVRAPARLPAEGRN
jgi:hypothetical protein